MSCLISLYDKIYPPDDAAASAEFYFFDAQMTKSASAFIDFSHFRIVPRSEVRAEQTQPVYSLADLFVTQKNDPGCVNYTNGAPLISKSDCRKHLQRCKPLWHLPSISTSPHALSLGHARWYEFYRDDFAGWFEEEPLRSEIHRLTFQLGPEFALQEDPQIYQTIFNRLTFLLKQWHSEDIELQPNIIF